MHVPHRAAATLGFVLVATATLQPAASAAPSADAAGTIPIITGAQAPADDVAVQAGIDLATKVGTNLSETEFKSTMTDLVAKLVQMRDAGASIPQIKPVPR